MGVEEIYHDLRFPDSPPDRPYTAINMVSTADGRVTVGNRADGIGGPADRLAMRLLRSRVDAVMVGARTVRSEKINLGLPGDLRGMVHDSNPLGVVLSASGDVPLDNLVQNDGERLLFLLSEEAPGSAEERLSARGEVRSMGEGSGGYEAYEAALSLLRDEYGVRRLLVEGGPSINHALVGAGLVDELFLTFAPKLAGGAAGGILAGRALPEPARMRLLSAYESGGELYLRYSLR